MIYQVLSELKVRTDYGETEVHPGQVINASPEKAQLLIETGKITPLEVQSNVQDIETPIRDVANMSLDTFPEANLEVKVESSVLGEVILFVSNDKMAKGLKDKGFVVYTADELKDIVKFNPDTEALKRIHEVKQVFKGSEVVQ
jgi:hypothetical protein